MAKNIVVCCDGTSNQFGDKNTNVVKLFRVLKKGEPGQVAYYHPGVGTMQPPGALTWLSKTLTIVAGLAFGYGLTNDIRDAYVFLMNNYEKGDRIFLFGFSRGAYTVRAVASLLRMYGLIHKGNDALVPYAIRLMGAINDLPDSDDAAEKTAAGNIFAEANAFRATFATPCPIYFAGVWDTVSSVGWISNPFRAPYTASNGAIEIGRHAMSIDERRLFFPVSPWFPKGRQPGPADVKQVWFTGDHSDVGGGQPEAQSGLSKLALEWMICEAVTHGLEIVPEQFDAMLGYPLKAPAKPYYVRPDPGGPAHDSINLTSVGGIGWSLAEFAPKRRFNAQKERWLWHWAPFRNGRVISMDRTVSPEASVHDAVDLRGKDYAARVPAAMPRLKTVYPDALKTTQSYLARNPWVE
jgi:uncharacterized protein (DUF2235 family)